MANDHSLFQYNRIMKMKAYFFLTLLIAVVSGLNAQVLESHSKSYAHKNLDFGEVSQAEISRSQRSSIIDTIWFNDFSDTTEWSYQGGVNEWLIDANLSQSLINQGFDPLLMSVSGGRFAYIDSDGAGGGQTQDATVDYMGSIDCSSYPNVQIVFQTYFRKFNDVRQVLISNDGGLAWDTLDVLTQFGASVTSANPYTEIVDITSVAGGESNVQIKFRYVGAYDWFWAIDDILLQPVPNNELALTQEFYNTTTDLTYGTYYTMIPKKQADSARINFGANVKNNGLVDQTNTQVSVNVNFEGNSIFTDTTLADSLIAGAIGLYDFSTTLSLDSGLGLYDFEMEVFSDSTDAVPRNNMIQQRFEVSSYQYRRDNDTVNSDNWFEVNTSLEMLVRYEIFTDDSVVALSTYFPFNFITGRGLIEGDLISYYVYESGDLNTPVSQNENYIVTALDVNSWVTLPMPNVGLTPGMYYVGFKVFGNSSSVGTNSNLNSKTAPLNVLLRQDATSSASPWQTTTSFMPFVRMFTKTDSACADVQLGVDFTVIDSMEVGQVLANVTGTGAAPYIYSWEGPQGFNATSQNISNLTEKGSYVLTVTDVFGCQGVDSAVVAGAVSVSDIEVRSNFRVFPNPVFERLQVIGLVSHQGRYEIKLINVLGAEVYSKTENVTGVLNTYVNMRNLDSGVYFVIISEGNGNVLSIPIIKK